MDKFIFNCKVLSFCCSFFAGLVKICSQDILSQAPEIINPLLLLMQPIAPLYQTLPIW